MDIGPQLTDGRGYHQPPVITRPAAHFIQAFYRSPTCLGTARASTSRPLRVGSCRPRRSRKGTFAEASVVWPESGRGARPLRVDSRHSSE